MSGIIERNLHRSIAAAIIEVEKETSIPASELAEIMNDEYGYVSEEEMGKLKRQMELDVAADKHARESKLKVDKVAVGRTALDRTMGKLVNKFRDEEVDMDQSSIKL
ncbi:hypothetical protein [Psychrobacter alimentarius]|uniref:hypothetical protein n=1 Tax=Psychrobacter alimentarius TaxID=261164 RepID=UPI00191B22A4|nr:hypothetical protein [Psychrobacter alimentarius]